MSDRSIGVFDSGLGGLTVLKEIVDMMPNENIIYFGDTARVPYGPKKEEDVRSYTFQAIDFFISEGVKAVVIACNTATASALNEAKIKYDIPIIGVIEAGARTALDLTTNNIVGVIGTEGTIKSKAYEKEIGKMNDAINVVSKACPLFVPIVEDGLIHTDNSYKIAQEYLNVMKERKVDSLVLGCTHYPHLKSVIGKVVGSKVKLVDPARETVKDLKNELEGRDILNKSRKQASCKYYVTGDPGKFASMAKELTGRELGDINHLDISDR